MDADLGGGEALGEEDGEVVGDPLFELGGHPRTASWSPGVAQMSSIIVMSRGSRSVAGALTYISLGMLSEVGIVLET